MDQNVFSDLGAAVEDEQFPEVDLALRRGRHIDREDAAWYGYLLEAQSVLEPFYRRFGCELIHKSDGYFYLLPTSDKLGRRQLSASEMLVGQALALLYLDPSTIQSGGVVTQKDVLGHMAQVMGMDGLMGAFNPKKKRLDERVAQETVRARVAEGLRKLASGGFIEALEGDGYRLRSALMRFAEPVRTSDSPTEALRRLVEKGEVVLTDPTLRASDEGDGEGASREDEADRPRFDDTGDDEDLDGFEHGSSDGTQDEASEDEDGPSEDDEVAPEGEDDGTSEDDEDDSVATDDETSEDDEDDSVATDDASQDLNEKLEALDAEFDELFDDGLAPDSER